MNYRTKELATQQSRRMDAFFFHRQASHVVYDANAYDTILIRNIQNLYSVIDFNVNLAKQKICVYL